MTDPTSAFLTALDAYDEARLSEGVADTANDAALYIERHKIVKAARVDLVTAFRFAVQAERESTMRGYGGEMYIAGHTAGQVEVDNAIEALGDKEDGEVRLRRHSNGGLALWLVDVATMADDQESPTGAILAAARELRIAP